MLANNPIAIAVNNLGLTRIACKNLRKIIWGDLMVIDPLELSRQYAMLAYR
jgi:hypothetical protein